MKQPQAFLCAALSGPLAPPRAPHPRVGFPGSRSRLPLAVPLTHAGVCAALPLSPSHRSLPPGLSVSLSLCLTLSVSLSLCLTLSISLSLSVPHPVCKSVCLCLTLSVSLSVPHAVRKSVPVRASKAAPQVAASLPSFWVPYLCVKIQYLFFSF